MGLAPDVPHVVEDLEGQCPLGVDDLVSPGQAIGPHIQMPWNVARNQGNVSAVHPLEEVYSLPVQGL